jgi:hypothetical protein
MSVRASRPEPRDNGVVFTPVVPVLSYVRRKFSGVDPRLEPGGLELRYGTGLKTLAAQQLQGLSGVGWAQLPM